MKECEDKLKGLGVFAKQDIAKGTMIWRPTSLIEKLSVEEVKARLESMTAEEAGVFWSNKLFLLHEKNLIQVSSKLH